MPKSSKFECDSLVSDCKAPVIAMTDGRKLEIVAQLTDDVLSKLVGAFFDVCKFERWTKRDLATISGINETAINHILAGRRKNLTVETIALLARAMGTRPEIVLHDARPSGNQPPRNASVEAFSSLSDVQERPKASALQSAQVNELQRTASGAARFAYTQSDLLGQDR